MYISVGGLGFVQRMDASLEKAEEGLWTELLLATCTSPTLGPAILDAFGRLDASLLGSWSAVRQPIRCVPQTCNLPTSLKG